MDKIIFACIAIGGTAIQIWFDGKKTPEQRAKKAKQEAKRDWWCLVICTVIFGIFILSQVADAISNFSIPVHIVKEIK